jgi:hypothetical protein
MPATYPPAETLVITVDDTLQAVSLAFDTSAIVIPEPQTQTVVLAMEDMMGQPGQPGPPGIAGSPGPQGPPGGSSNLFQYSLNSQVVSPPSNGQIRLNNSNQQLATLAWISYNTQDNIDSTVAWKFAKAGDKLYIQDKNNSTNAQLYHLTADAVDHTSYAQLAIAWDQTGGNPVPAQICLVAVTRPGAQGPPGAAATINVGTTSTLSPGSLATVTNIGTTAAALFNFGIPAGQTGNQGTIGNPGPAATVNAGTTSTLTPGSNATVTNVGTTSAAIFNFGIPQGLPGTGSGDMTKAIYDTDNNNVVDTCDSLAYSKLTSVPASFTPSAHASTHVTGGSDIILAASASTAGLLNKLSGNTTDFVDGTNTCQALAPQIWSVRLRSYNAIGNPGGEVDQRNVFALVTNPAGGSLPIDRWSVMRGGTNVWNIQSVGDLSVNVPGTNFRISRTFMRITLTTQQTTLASTDRGGIAQAVEGPMWRELSNDVHSVSLLVRCSSPLKFGLCLNDNVAAYSLAKLCTISIANQWTLITLPNLPIWTPSGTWATVVGTTSYYFRITLIAGSGMQPSANDAWVAGATFGALGQDNFAALPVNSTFDVGYVQHEPGPVCTSLQDKPFSVNYDECLRYYAKSWNFATAAGTGGSVPAPTTLYALVAGTNLWTSLVFKKKMAKAPTMTAYSQVTGAANMVRFGGADVAVSGAITAGEDAGPNVITVTTSQAIGTGYWHWTADTGW